MSAVTKKNEELLALYTTYAPPKQKQLSEQQGAAHALYANAIKEGSTRELASFAGRMAIAQPPKVSASREEPRTCIPTQSEGPKLTYPRAIALGALKGIAGPVVFVAGIIAHPEQAVHAVVDAPVQAICAISNTVNHPVDTTRKVAQVVSDINDMPGPEKTEKGVEFAVSIATLAAAGKVIKGVLPKRSVEFERVMACEQDYLSQVLTAIEKAHKRTSTMEPTEKAWSNIKALPAPVKENSLERFMRPQTTHKEINPRVTRVPLSEGPRSIIKKTDDMNQIFSEIFHLDAIGKLQPKHFSVPELLGFAQNNQPGTAGYYMTDLPGVPIKTLLKAAQSAKCYEPLKEVFTALGRAHGELHTMIQKKLPAEESKRISKALLNEYKEVHDEIGYLGIPSPYAAREIRQLTANAQNGPQVVCVIQTDSGLGNVLWDAPSKRIGLIDFGENEALNHRQFHMRHPGDGLGELLGGLHASCRELGISPEVQSSLIASVWEGYRPLAHPLFSEDVFKYWKTRGIYNDLVLEFTGYKSISEQTSLVTRTYKLLELEKQAL